MSKTKPLTKAEKDGVMTLFGSPELIKEHGAFTGYVGEEYILRKLRNEGFLVTRTQITCGIENIFNSKELRYLLSLYSKGNRLFALLEKNSIGLPDFICLKNNEVSFVEVKSNGAELNEQQKKIIELLKSKGYKVNIRRPKVKMWLEENGEELNNTGVQFVSKDQLTSKNSGDNCLFPYNKETTN